MKVQITNKSSWTSRKDSQKVRLLTHDCIVSPKISDTGSALVVHGGSSSSSALSQTTHHVGRVQLTTVTSTLVQRSEVVGTWQFPKYPTDECGCAHVE